MAFSPSLKENLATLLEATERQKQKASLRKQRRLQNQMQRSIGRWFIRQGLDMRRALRPLRQRVNALAEADLTPYEPYIDQALRQNGDALESIIDQFTKMALLAGTSHVLGQFPALAISFTLENPEAVAWADGRAARQVKRINETTRVAMRRLITTSVAEGWSYNKLARGISGMFTQMSRTRARNIAVFEISDAFEAGSAMMANQITASGLQLEKKWLTVGDGKVRPEHKANQAAGYIPLSTSSFPSGDARPPTDPGCRCTLVYRRARNVTR